MVKWLVRFDPVGDPISLLLFLLAQQVISTDLNQSIQAGLVSSYKVGRGVNSQFLTSSMQMLFLCLWTGLLVPLERWWDYYIFMNGPRVNSLVWRRALSILASEQLIESNKVLDQFRHFIPPHLDEKVSEICLNHQPSTWPTKVFFDWKWWILGQEVHGDYTSPGSEKSLGRASMAQLSSACVSMPLLQEVRCWIH